MKTLDVNYKNLRGLTALMKFSREGRTEAMKFLFVNGADVDVKNNDGATALMCASEKGHIAAVKLLIQNGTDASLRDSRKRIASELATDRQVANFLRTYKPQSQHTLRCSYLFLIS